MKVNKILRFIVVHLCLLVLVFGLQQVINFLTYDIRGPLAFIIEKVSFLKDNKDFVMAIGWYIVQIVITYILIKVILRRDLKSIGLNNLNSNLTIKYIKLFVFYFPLIVVFIWFIIYLLLGLDTLIYPYQGRDFIYAIKDLIVFGTLPGLSEEPFFRVFVMQFILIFLYKNLDLQEKNIKNKIIFYSAFYFMLGHIFIASLIPFSINYNLLQLISALLLGVFYSITYIRTKSAIAAIVCHSYSDFIMFLFGYLHYFMLG